MRIVHLSCIGDTSAGSLAARGGRFPFGFVLSMRKTSQEEWGSLFVAEIIFHFKKPFTLALQLWRKQRWSGLRGSEDEGRQFSKVVTCKDLWLGRERFYRTLVSPHRSMFHKAHCSHVSAAVAAALIRWP